MYKYQKLKIEYDNLIKKCLSDNKKILIESFVEYYGEEHRSIIENKYNEIVFVYYIDLETIDSIISDFIPLTENKEKYQIFIDFRNLYNSKKSKFFKLFQNKNKKNLPDNFIGTTNTEILKCEYIRSRMFEFFRDSRAVNTNYRNGSKINRMVVFQILSLSEESIIHEINHAITRAIMVDIFEENQFIYNIEKIGLSVDSSYERIIEELINDKASVEITKIFKQKGGDLTAFCYDIPFVYPYKENFYLIDEFYGAFKKYIKIARITERKNELISRIGKDNYNEYVKLINSFYSEDLIDFMGNKDAKLREIKNLIDKMKNNVASTNNISQKQLNEYYENLRKNGYNVRVINEISDNQDSIEFDNSNRRK